MQNNYMSCITQNEIDCYDADKFLKPGSEFFFDVMRDDVTGEYYALTPKRFGNEALAEVELKRYNRSTHVARWRVKMKEQPKGGEVWQ